MLDCLSELYYAAHGIGSPSCRQLAWVFLDGPCLDAIALSHVQRCLCTDMSRNLVETQPRSGSNILTVTGIILSSGPSIDWAKGFFLKCRTSLLKVRAKSHVQDPCSFCSYSCKPLCKSLSQRRCLEREVIMIHYSQWSIIKLHHSGTRHIPNRP